MKTALKAMKDIVPHHPAYARGLMEASLDPMFTISTAGKMTDMNEATLKMTGLTRDQMNDTDFSCYFTEPESARVICKDVFARGSVANSPLTMTDANHTELLFNGSVFRDTAGITQGAVIVARLAGGQKQIEKELTEAIAFSELATGMAEEAQARAEKATKVAEDAMTAKQQFLSNMSHEIRTPMSAIIGFTKVLLRSDLNVKQKEYLRAIKVSGESLIVLINDILDLAKVDAGKMTFEQISFKMSTSISTMLHLFETPVSEKNIELVLEYDSSIPEYLIGDQIRLRQIILNLVSNAVKFTVAGGITVRVTSQSEDNESVVIKYSVEDTGIGIAKENLDNIFESFQQGSKGTARIYGGTGLGLAIVKKLVEGQNGTINVTSTPGKGSVFSFVLRFGKTNAPGDTENHPREAGIAPRHIKALVVEDIPLNQLLIQTLLDEFGFESEYANNGKIAIELMEKNMAEKQRPYEIVLMDLHMPVMDGFETTEYIRKTLGSTIPILALSADVTTVDAAKCRAAGMNDYMTKPVDERELYHKIIQLTRKAITKFHLTAPGTEPQPFTYLDLRDLENRTRSSPNLRAEIIDLYLEQTPVLVKAMKASLINKDMKTLNAAVHKMIPSFRVMGMKTECESIAREVLELSVQSGPSERLGALVRRLEKICNKTCEDLKTDLTHPTTKKT